MWKIHHTNHSLDQKHLLQLEMDHSIQCYRIPLAIYKIIIREQEREGGGEENDEKKIKQKNGREEKKERGADKEKKNIHLEKTNHKEHNQFEDKISQLHHKRKFLQKDKGLGQTPFEQQPLHNQHPTQFHSQTTFFDQQVVEGQQSTQIQNKTTTTSQKTSGSSPAAPCVAWKIQKGRLAKEKKIQKKISVHYAQNAQKIFEMVLGVVNKNKNPTIKRKSSKNFPREVSQKNKTK